MIEIRCDKCKAILDNYEICNIEISGDGVSQLFENDYTEISNIDLCPDCLKDVLQYIHEVEGEEPDESDFRQDS